MADLNYQWNMAESFMRSLHAKLDRFSDFVFIGDFFAAHRVLKDVYYDVKHRIDLDTDKEQVNNIIKEWFDESEKALSPVGNSQNKQIAAQMMAYKFNNSEEALYKIKEKLMSLLYKFGLLYPKVQYQTFEEEIQSDFL